MTFYDSFARLGKNLDQITSPNNIAWTWRHYFGLHYQSFSERTAASEAFCPMAWVWSSYRSSLPITVIDIAQEAEPIAEHIALPHLIADEVVQTNRSADHGIDYPTVEPYRLQIEAPTYDEEAIRFIDILKLVGSFVFAALIIYGVHELRN